MRDRLLTLELVLVLSVWVLSSCGPAMDQPSEVSTPAPKKPVVVPLTLVPAITPTGVVEASDAQAARDAALAYVSGRYADHATPAN